jgi:hypothetical protein
VYPRLSFLRKLGQWELRLSRRSGLKKGEKIVRLRCLHARMNTEYQRVHIVQVHDFSYVGLTAARRRVRVILGSILIFVSSGITRRAGSVTHLSGVFRRLLVEVFPVLPILVCLERISTGTVEEHLASKTLKTYDRRNEGIIGVRGFYEFIQS